MVNRLHRVLDSEEGEISRCPEFRNFPQKYHQSLEHGVVWCESNRLYAWVLVFEHC